jgi:hypothetical protein
MNFKDDDFYKQSRFDWLLIVFILFLSLAGMLWFNRGFFKEPSGLKTALVYEKDSLREKLDLSNDRVIAILNGKMQIEVKGQRLRVIEADCPQHVCMNMGWIHYSGQTIVCVPNKVLIEIASGQAPLLDAVVY